MKTLTFTLKSDGFYTAEFQTDGKCHVQINKEPDNAGETVFEAAIDGEPYTTLQPTYDSSGILAEIDLPAGFNVRIKSTTPVTYAAVLDGTGESPTPGPEYDIFCPQVISTNVFRKGYNNPCYRRSLICYLATVAIEYTPEIYLYIDWIGDKHVPSYSRDPMDYITEENIQAWKTSMSTSQRPMTEETEKWLRDRIGRFLITYDINPQGFGQDIKNYMLVSYSATNYESKPVTVYE